MAAYYIADVEITNPEEYQTYARQVPPTLSQYGGKFLVRGGQSETIEGNWNTKRIVIIEFPSIEQAKAWYASPAYSSIAGIRHHSANSQIILVQGA